ncbi:MAG: MucR family transcriptional regulator [Rhodospirillales bacterium]
MTKDVFEKVSRLDILRMSVDIVAAYVAGNNVNPPQIPETIHRVFDTLRTLPESTGGTDVVRTKPAVSIRRSVMPDYLVCLEDGRRLKMLKRHLRTAYGLTPDEYRSRWNLPPDYPMVAPNYAKRRSKFAKKIGLGRKRA